MNVPSDSWSAAVDGYADFAADCTRLFAEDLLRLVPAVRGRRGLDLATGTGVVALAAARTGGRIAAVDASLAMIRHVAGAAAVAGIDRLPLAVQDGCRLAFADGTFDVVWSLFGLTLFEDPRRGLAECRRVLTPGGRLAVGAWGRRQDTARVLLEAVRRTLPGRLATLPHPTGLGWCSRDALAAALGDAGFDHVQVVTVRRPWIVASAETFWERLPAYSPTSAAGLATLDADERAALGRRVVLDLTLRFGDGPVVLETEAHLGLATR